MESSQESSALHSQSAMLVIVDMQVGHLPGIRTTSPERLILACVQLCEIAKTFGMPIIVTTSRQAPPQGSLIPELAAFDGAKIERNIINAWNDVRFRSAVEAAGRRHIIFAGVALDVGVAGPAISAVESGFAVHVPIDAVGTTDARIELASQLRLSASGVALTSVQAVGMGLLADITSSHARDTFSVLGKSHDVHESPFLL